METAETQNLKKTGIIFKTHDYFIFENVSGNRATNDLHIKRLMDSFNKEYLVNPIIVNENYQIIDGQHRFEAAKRLELPIYCIIQKGYSLKEVQLLNMNQTNWTNKDYLESYSELGYNSYVQFKDFWEEYPMFSFTAILILLSQMTGNPHSKFTVHKQRGGKKSIARSSIKIRFKEGDFEIPDLSKSESFAKKILKVKKYYSGYNRTLFVRTMVSLFKNPNYDHNEFLKKLESGEKNDILVNFSTVLQYKVAIEKIYNHRRIFENRVVLRDL